MISKSEYPTDVRVRREAEALSSAGHDVEVVTTDPVDLVFGGIGVRGVGAVSGLTTSRPRDSPAYRVARWALLPQHRQRAIDQFQERVLAIGSDLTEPPDVVHAHDFPALSPASRLADLYSAALVYDSHEFWSGLPRYGRPEPWRHRRQMAAERELVHRADEVITVSQGAAEAIANMLGLEHVSVVRNTFPIRTDLTVSENPGGAVYAGRIGPGRDLETVFSASGWDDRRRLHLMGKAEPKFPIPDFPIRHEAGSMDDVDQLIASVGVALVTLVAGPANHDVALPNKLFQAISAGVPVIAADLPEIRRVVTDSGAGTLYEPGSVKSFADAFNSLAANYSATRERIAHTRSGYGWAIDSSVLAAIYNRLGTSTRR